MNKRMATGVAVAVGVVLSVSGCGPADDGQSASAAGSAAGQASSTGSATAAVSTSASGTAASGVSASAGSTAGTAAPTGSGVPASPLAASGTASAAAPAAAPAQSATSVQSPSGSAALPTSDKAAANCVAGHLRWTLIHLDQAATTPGDPAPARLTAVNTGGSPCAFDGYPGFRVHVGKGPEVVAVGARTVPSRLVLAPGRSVVVDLHYAEVPDTSGYCFLSTGTLAQAQVLPPHAAPHEVGTGLPMTDSHGKRVPMTVCGENMWMSAPVLH